MNIVKLHVFEFITHKPLLNIVTINRFVGIRCTVAIEIVFIVHLSQPHTHSHTHNFYYIPFPTGIKIKVYIRYLYK